MKKFFSDLKALFRDIKQFFKNENNKERIYIQLIILLVLIFLIAYSVLSALKINTDYITKPITTTLALISAVAFWLQFKRTQRLNESNYIMNFNNQFITNKDMCHIEHVLELYYNKYEEEFGEKSIDIPLAKVVEKVKKINLGLDLSRTSDDCQKLINYLVYLEALAALVEQQVVHLDVVDDLLSYRFFLAVNNPIVQECELLGYEAYYKGIFRLAERWTKDHHKSNKTIPMERFSLTKENLAILAEYRPINDIEVSEAKSSDSKIEIAECIYDTDQYIYPEAFGDDRDFAVRAISRLVGMNVFILDYRNIIVARMNGKVCGVCVISEGKEKWDANILELIKKRVGKEYLQEGLKEGLQYAFNNYFCTIGTGLPENTVELVVCSVKEGHRRKGIATQMLEYVINKYKGKNIQLTVLEENKVAINAYSSDRLGFITLEQEPKYGFAAEGLAGPPIRKMIRYADK